jgi:ferredoxin
MNRDKDRTLYIQIMRFFPIIFFALASATIKNYQAPICQNCIHYRPNLFSPSLSKCAQFGDKNIITGEIKHDYADLSRLAEDKCGLQGKYFNETPLIIQALQFAFIHNLPNKIVVALIFLSIWAKTI